MGKGYGGKNRSVVGREAEPSGKEAKPARLNRQEDAVQQETVENGGEITRFDERKDTLQQETTVKKKKRATLLDRQIGAVQRGTVANGGKSGRPEVPCPVFGRCGGCQMLDIPYGEQLKRKQHTAQRLLGGLCTVQPITGMADPFHYRNKVHAVFGYRRGEIISGVYQEGSHRIVPVRSCLIEDRKADEIISTVRELAQSFKIKAYDEDTGLGLLRHVLVKRGFATGEIMVVLVTASPVFPSRNHFVKALCGRHPEITTVIQNLNDRSTSMVLGEREQVLYGKGYIEDELCGCRFRISGKSFYQVNPSQAERLYVKAMELAALTGSETVVDAYCGTGTIGIIASARAGRVIGVELNRDAVRDAVANAKRNRAENVRFYANDAAAFVTGMASQGEHADVIFLDPPRSGAAEEFIRAAAALKPERVVYISCNPETLARDLKEFRQFGYRAGDAWPYDLFPQTDHLEVIVSMSRAGGKAAVR